MKKKITQIISNILKIDKTIIIEKIETPPAKNM